MKRPSTKPVIAPPPVECRRAYLVTMYHTGDFRGLCLQVRIMKVGSYARFKVTDAIRSSLALDDEIDVPLQLARFLPTVYEQFAGGSKTPAVKGPNA